MRGRRSPMVVLTALATLAGAGGCLFTDPINMPPVVEKIESTAEVWRKMPATFTAVVSDPNGDHVDVEWTHVTKASAMGAYSCPTGANVTVDRTLWPSNTRLRVDQYEVPRADTDGTFCVWAFARDRYGAERAARPLEVVPGNRSPVASLAAGSSASPPSCTSPSATLFGRYDSVTFLACSHDDEQDQVTYAWRLMAAPSVSVATLGTCSGLADTSQRCFDPDAEGDFIVELTATDGHGGTSIATQQVSVQPDRFPCLKRMSVDGAESDVNHMVVHKASDDPAQVTFAVDQVDDDGDPYPTKTGSTGPTYTWSTGPADGALVSVGPWSYPTFQEPGGHRLGDVVRVRVEIRDRRVEDITNALVAACSIDADVCAADRSDLTCLQRVTWTVRYDL